VRKGEIIRTERLRRKMPQRVLATKVGVSTNYISAIEIGVRNPSPEIMDKIAAAFELSTDVLFGEKTFSMRAFNFVVEKETPEKKYMLCFFKELDDEPPLLSCQIASDGECAFSIIETLSQLIVKTPIMRPRITENLKKISEEKILMVWEFI
jgi:transcriptional regulator with XRE-family HTH domain